MYIAVNRIAFVVPENSGVLQDLTRSLQECHGCERVHPVASNGSSDQSLSSSNLHLQICNWLNSDCLVYIIWEGSLEALDNQSIVKCMVKQFSHRKMLDLRERGVIHRLVFLQLGSGGVVRREVSHNNSLWVFQSRSSTDRGFDPKLCGLEVYDIVHSRLQELGQQTAANLQSRLGDSQPSQSGANKHLYHSDRPQPPQGDRHPPPQDDRHPPPQDDRHPLPQDDRHPLPQDDRHPPSQDDRHPPPQYDRHPLTVGDRHPPPQDDKHSPPQGDKHPPPQDDKHPPPQGDSEMLNKIFTTMVEMKTKNEALHKTLGSKVDGFHDTLDGKELAEEQDLGETEAETTLDEIAETNNFNAKNTGLNKVNKILDKK